MSSNNSNDSDESSHKAASLNGKQVFIHHEKSLDDAEIHGVTAGFVNEGYMEILKAHPVSRWSKERLTIYFTCFVVYLVSTTNGYDGSLLSSLIAMPEFISHLDIKSASGTGIVFAIFQVGQMVATLFVWLGDFIGRRNAIFIGSAIVCIGAIVTSVANNTSTFIGGRFLLSFGSGISCALATTYLLEITPPDERSALCAVYNSLYYIGSIIATWSSYATSIDYADSVLAFRIPLWLQILCPGLVVIGLACGIAPESPRFHYMTGEHEKAQEFFVKYHANGDTNHPIVEYEIAQLELSLLEVPKLRVRDYFDVRILFKTHSRVYRSLVCIAHSAFGQLSGNAVVGYYITNIFLDLGIENATTRLLLNGVNSILGFVFAMVGSVLVGRIGRRFMLLYSTTGFVICFTVIAACIAAHTNNNNQTAAKVGIAFIYIFNNVFFSFGYTPLQPLYPAEILSSEMRAKGMALFQITQGTASFINTYAAPVAMQNINYWYYVFFVFWDTFEVIIIYLYFVETKNLTLEEIELIFESSTPVKSSKIMSSPGAESNAEKVRLANLKLHSKVVV
ncbi:lactose permease [Scheffersomyces xylosifermentans]|uniref:lactose permease n=1 Tax=Scheffersomyces xylosifermentans TaxID=1304137 RepID=UPI00315CA00B